jgi:hypothetical protein
MTNRTLTGLLLVVLAEGAAGCGSSSSSPIAPTPPAQQTQPPAQQTQERWSLTRTFTGHTGSEGCTIALDTIATVSDSVLLIQRSGPSMRFFTADHNNYVGAVAGNEFVATEVEDFGSTLQCGEDRVRFRTEARVSGRLSSDGMALVGEETSVFFLQSGKTITRHWDWQARRD